MDEKFMYESELKDLIELELSKLYNSNTVNIFNYTLIRFMLIENIKDIRVINKQKLGRFILEELNITIYDNHFIYKDTRINISGLFEIFSNLPCHFAIQSPFFIALSDTIYPCLVILLAVSMARIAFCTWCLPSRRISYMSDFS